MKKISLFVLSVCTAMVVTAQTSSVGVKGGLNLSTTTSDQGGNRDMRPGFHVGAFAHMHMGPRWALQPEVVYSSQGNKYTTTSGTEHKLKLDYLNVPFLFQYFAAPGLRLQTGPQIGFLLDAEDKVADVETGIFTKNDFKDIDASWAIGVSYIGKAGLGFDARYNLGLTNINNFGTANVRNSVIQAGLFYQFSGR